MISRDSLKSFPYVFKSGIASIDITKTYIWVLLKNASFIIISKSDPKQIITNTFQNPEKVKLNEKCKIYASPDEKGCMMLLFNELFYFDMNKPNEIPKQIKLHDPVESKKISCGAWFEEDDYLYFICCTSTGKIFQLSPDSTAFTNYLFNFPEKVIINNIVILSLKQTFVFVFVSTNISADGKIVIFFGEESWKIAKIFAEGKTNSNIGIGTANPRVLDRSNRYKNTFSVISFENIILYLSEPKWRKNQVKINQDGYESKNIVAFNCWEYGAFVSKKDNIQYSFYNDSKQLAVNQFLIQLPNVIKIMFDESNIWFITERILYNIEIKEFLKLASDIAFELKFYKFVLQTSDISSDSSKRNISLQELMKTLTPEELIELILSLNWPLDFILQTFIDSPLFLIKYLNAYLLNQSSDSPPQILHLIALLYSQQLPEMKNQFLEFIEKNYNNFSKQSLLQILKKVNFWEGIEKYLYLIQDFETLINECNYYQVNDNLLTYIKNSRNLIQLTKNIKKILKMDQNSSQELALALHNLPYFTPEQLVPIISQLPDFPIQSLKQNFPRGEIYSIILCMSYCKNKDDVSIVKMVKDGLIDPSKALRFCLLTNCKNAATEILWNQSKPEYAIDMGMPEFEEKIKFLIRRENDVKLKKRGWIHLLKKTAGSKRREVMSELLETDLFQFNEILEYADDLDTIMQYKDIMIEAVDQIQETAKHVHYRTKFAPIQFPEEKIKLTDNCVLCMNPLFGQKFVIFPCRHMAHTQCLKDNLKKLNIQTNTPSEDLYIRSCPICGFNSIPSACGMSE